VAVDDWNSSPLSPMNQEWMGKSQAFDNLGRVVTVTAVASYHYHTAGVSSRLASMASACCRRKLA